MKYVSSHHNLLDWDELAKNISKLEKSNLPERIKESAISSVSLCADYAYVLYLLGRTWAGDDLLDKAKQEYAFITEDKESVRDSFTFSPDDTVSYVYWQSYIKTAEYFIENSIIDYENGQTKNSKFHPFGYIDYSNTFMRVSYETFITITQDTDKNFDYVHKNVERIVSGLIEDVFNIYSAATDYRLELINSSDSIATTTIYSMFSNNNSVKKFKEYLKNMIDVTITLGATKSNLMDKLSTMIEQASKNGFSVMPLSMDEINNAYGKKEDKGFQIPDDIDELFS